MPLFCLDELQRVVLDLRVAEAQVVAPLILSVLNDQDAHQMAMQSKESSELGGPDR